MADPAATIDVTMSEPEPEIVTPMTAPARIDSKNNGAERASGESRKRVAEHDENGNNDTADPESSLPRKKRVVEINKEDGNEGDDVVMETSQSDAPSSNDDGENAPVPDTPMEVDEETHRVKLEVFYAEVEEGQSVDVLCVKTRQWLPAKIEAIDEDVLMVHFMGWNKKSDEAIPRDDWSRRIAPCRTHAAEAWKKQDELIAKREIAKQRKREQQEALLAARMNAETVEEPSSFVEAGQTRSGRKMTKRVIPDGAVAKRPAPAQPKKKSVEDEVAEIQAENPCATCGEFEDDALTDMILCDGGCLNSYHLSCLGLEEVPDEETWLCEQCRTNEQQCFACGRNGTIGEKGGVFRCSIPTCGKFYHQRCVDANKLSRRKGKAAEQKLNNETPVENDQASADEESDVLMGSFRCPRHICSVCEDTKRGKELMHCLKCPEAYHPHCVPPSARYNNIGLLCYRHPGDSLPRIPAQYLLDRSFDHVTVDFNLRLPSLFLPKNEPGAHDRSDCHHFRLPMDMMDDVKTRPPPYRTLVRNIYTFKQPKESLEDVPMCVCKKACDDNCINRLSFTECFGPAPNPGVPFNRADKNKESNCPLGEDCGNRALHQRIYPRFEKFHTPDKGWALRVLEPVKAGQLVIEYVGEVINEEEKNRRLTEHARLHPEDKNMYIMELSNGVYIDARLKGSVSRFINHSCDPNCHLLKWNVRGVNRIGITARKDIAAGEELSYDYQFHTTSALEWRCYCKSKNCRGTMAPEKLNGDVRDEPSKKLSKKEMQKKMKRAQQMEKIMSEKDKRDTARRLSNTAAISRSISRTGPAPRELQWATHTRVFLARNARTGFDFLQRKQLLEQRIAAAPKSSRRPIVSTEDVLATSEVAPSPGMPVEIAPKTEDAPALINECSMQQADALLKVETDRVSSDEVESPAVPSVKTDVEQCQAEAHADEPTEQIAG